MPRSRKIPVTALFVAIINLVLFVPCLCCSGAGLAMVGAGGGGSAFALDPKQKEELKKQEKIVEEKVPNQKAIGMAFSFGNVLGSILMIVAAIGLLKKQSWGRLVCIFGSILLIVVSLANVVYQATSVLPVTLKIQEEEMRKQNPGAAPPAGFVETVAYGTLVVMAVFMAGYPLIALILMMTGSVREFYSSSAQDQFADDMERAEDDRRRDEECDDRRRDEGGDDRIRGDHDR